MTESSWPFDATDSTETQYSLLFRRTQDTGVIDGYGPFGGVLKPYADGSGMNVKVPAGDAVVQGFYYRNDAVITLTVPAASTQARIDSVVLRLDTAANTVTCVLKVGTAGSGVAPTLTQTDTVYEMKLGDVAVGASVSTIAAGNVTDQRTFSSVNWGKWATATRPSNPEYGRAGFNFTLGQPEYWNGSAWTLFGQASTSASALTSGTLPNQRLDYGVMNAFRNDRSVDAPTNSNGVNGDWNNVYQPGVYRVYAGNSNVHAPTGAYMYGTLVVFGAGGNIESRTQVYYAHTGIMYWRTAWNSNDWGSWQSSQQATSSSSSSSTAVTSDGSISFASGVAANQVNDVIKVGRAVTLRFNINISTSKPAGGGADANILKINESGFWPKSAPADGFCHNGTGSVWGFAVDPDGWLRLRSAGYGGGGMWGTITFPTANA